MLQCESIKMDPWERRTLQKIDNMKNRPRPCRVKIPGKICKFRGWDRHEIETHERNHRRAIKNNSINISRRFERPILEELEVEYLDDEFQIDYQHLDEAENTASVSNPVHEQRPDPDVM